MPTVDLSDLQGVWKPFMRRRLKLHDRAQTVMGEAWRTHRPEWEPVLHLAGVHETVDQDVAASLTTALSAIIHDASLVTALTAQLIDAEAEGWVGALAVAADRAGAIGFNWELAFQHAYDAVKNLPAIKSAAVDAMASVGASTVTDLGNIIAAQLAAGGTYDDIIAALETTWDDAKALAYWVDVAMSAAMSQGALDLYASEGVANANWVTAGDQRVCAICEGNEEGNPWPAADMPVPPAHGRCRCVVTAADDLNSAAWVKFLTDQPSTGDD